MGSYKEPKKLIQEYLDEKAKSATLTGRGIQKAEQFFGISHRRECHHFGQIVLRVLQIPSFTYSFLGLRFNYNMYFMYTIY